MENQLDNPVIIPIEPSLDTGSHNEDMVDDIRSISSSNKQWSFGDCNISKGLAEFIAIQVALYILMIASIFGIFKDPSNVTLWASTLCLLIGVLSPNPKLETQKGSSAPSFIQKHYTVESRE